MFLLKLQIRFVGPFEITERIGTQAYRIQLPKNWSIYNVFHVSLLKKWKERLFTELKQLNLVRNSNIEEPNQRVVEKVLRWKKTGRGQPASILNFVARMPPGRSYLGKQPTDLNSEDFRSMDRSRPTS